MREKSGLILGRADRLFHSLFSTFLLAGKHFVCKNRLLIPVFLVSVGPEFFVFYRPLR